MDNPVEYISHHENDESTAEDHQTSDEITGKAEQVRQFAYIIALH